MSNEHDQYYLEQQTTVEKDFNSVPNLISTDKDLIVKNVFSVTNVERETKVGQKINLTIPTSAYTILLTDFYLGVRSVAVAPTLTLPLASVAGLGKIYIVKDLSGSALATTITITASGTDTIDGETTTAINTNYGKVGLFCDGQNWFTS